MEASSPNSPYWWSNSDGLSKVNPGSLWCNLPNIFKLIYFYQGCFAVSLGLHTAFYAELVAVLNVIDIAYSRNWLNLWIECDSPSVASSLVNRDYHTPWSLQNSWLNCLDKITRMRVQVTHIFREGSCWQIGKHGSQSSYSFMVGYASSWHPAPFD